MLPPSSSAHEKHRTNLFLAMHWSGGGIKTVAEIIAAYDWINRLVISKFELEDALSFLLAANLLERAGDGFKLCDWAYADFGAFLKRRKKNKFDAVELYFRRLPATGIVTDDVRFSEQQYRSFVSTSRDAARRGSRAKEVRAEADRT